MREILNINNFSVVPYAMCTDEKCLLNFIAQHGLPIIVKPNDGGGSENINFISELEETSLFSKNFKKNDAKFIVEKWIDGPEYSVESFTFAGKHKVLSIIEKQVNESFIEIGHIVPARLTQTQKQAIKEHVITFLDLIGMTNGPGHTELKLSKNGIRIIESHNRIGGGGINQLVRQVYDLDMIALSARWACREMFKEQINLKERGAAVTKALILKPGKIRSIDGLDALAEEAGDALIDFKLKYAENDIVPELRSNSNRAGYIIIFHNNVNDALKIAETALSKIKFNYY